MLRFEFCRLSEMDGKTTGIIRRRMSWSGGDMRVALLERSPDVYLCLLYYGRYLTTWVSLNSRKCIKAWTAAKYRGRGYAQMAAWELIAHRRKALRITKDTKFYVFHPSMGKIIERLGYKAWDLG